MSGGLVTVVMLIQALVAAVQQALHSQAHCMVVGGDVTQIPAMRCASQYRFCQGSRVENSCSSGVGFTNKMSLHYCTSQHAACTVSALSTP